MDEVQEKRLIYLTITLIFVFLVVYSIHLENPLPTHIDEWHHINEAYKIKNGIFPEGAFAVEAGFHLFLAILAKIFDLVLIYQFLPAIWAILSVITIYFIIRKKTFDLKDSFVLSISAILFFATIKSNINILGLWFFTPLTFSIPLIFLFLYLYTEGINSDKSRLILLSLAMMLILIFIHAISFLFAIPLLFIFSIMNYKKVIKHYKILSLFILFPIIGILFYKFMLKETWLVFINRLIFEIQFKYGWGISELNNSPFEVYSLVGYILAFIGLLTLALKKDYKKYLLFILWPIILIIQIIFFKITGVSYLSPYQRNLYYFAISLPFLSSFGLVFLKDKLTIYLNDKGFKEKSIKILSIIFIILIFFFAFYSYYRIPQGTLLYKAISVKEYRDITYLNKLPDGTILAPPDISVTIYPITGRKIVSHIVYRDDPKLADIKFFFSENSTCKDKDNIIMKYNVSYIFTRNETYCNYTLIYNKTDYIYTLIKQK